MAEKISTLILKVDLDCRMCYKKIRKILCKLQDKERIRTISYDDKSKSITIAGPFDPHKLSCRIRCMGGKVIKGIQIMDSGDTPATVAAPPPINKKPKETGPPPAEKPAPAATPPAPADREVSAATPAIDEAKKPKERSAELERPINLPAAPVEKERLPRPAAPKLIGPAGMMPIVEIPSWPALPVVPCGGSCYQGYYEGCRCYKCGRVYGYATRVGPPAAAPYCGVYRGCQLIIDEDPASACTIM